MTEPTVDDLFRWYKPVSLGSRQIWMRTLSATDDTARTKAATQASIRLRAKYIQEGSQEREDLLVAYGSIDRKELLAAIRVFRTEEAKALVSTEVQHKKDPPESQGPTLDDVMDAEEEWAKEITELAERRAAWVKEHVDTVLKMHEDQDDETLREKAIEMQISAFCTAEYIEEFNRQSICRACYDDKKFTKKTFASAEVAGGLDPRVFNKLLNEYYDLDRFALNAEYLKN